MKNVHIQEINEQLNESEYNLKNEIECKEKLKEKFEYDINFCTIEKEKYEQKINEFSDINNNYVQNIQKLEKENAMFDMNEIFQRNIVIELQAKQKNNEEIISILKENEMKMKIDLQSVINEKNHTSKYSFSCFFYAYIFILRLNLFFFVENTDNCP